NLTQAPRQNIAIAGETGSGKTTLLKIIAGLVQPDNGEIMFRNQKVIGPADKLIPGHKGIVYLSQDFRLPHFLRVEQILEYANEWPIEKADKLFSLCRIKHLFKRRTDELSGGEQQRIAIARLLIMDPRLFLLDEPFSNMDPANKDLLKNIIEDIGNEFHMSFIMISHDPVDTLPWANEIIVMKEGRIIEKNSPAQIYSTPSYAYTASLFGDYNIIPDQLLSSEKIALPNPGHQSLVRPEKCVIVASSTPSTNANGDANIKNFQLKGTVRAVRYFGHYVETDLMVGEFPFITRSQVAILNPGSEATIGINNADIQTVRI
ncbi:MAG: ABC transporter ATP-binding protein, partial [Chitinophagaceae bacterium]